MNNNHSPDSFYEKLVQDMSGTCRLCKESFKPSDMEDHFKIAHPIDNQVKDVIEDVLDKVIDLTDSENEQESDVESDVDENKINIDFEYSVEKVKCAETYKGKKPIFVQCVKELKKLLKEKGDVNAKIINEHKFVVKDSREVSYGMEADIEISKGMTKGLARVKVWGPSKSPNCKNKCTIIITKYPNSDPKYNKVVQKGDKAPS